MGFGGFLRRCWESGPKITVIHGVFVLVTLRDMNSWRLASRSYVGIRRGGEEGGGASPRPPRNSYGKKRQPRFLVSVSGG